MERPLRIHKRPRLKNPSLIAGWTDAGHIGINTVEYLIDKLGAEEFGEIESHNFSLLPYTQIKGGVVQGIEYPGNSLYYWKNRKSTGDLILLGSKPPDINHHQLANLILDVAELFDVSRIYTVGGIQANIAHTAPPRIFAIINNPNLRDYVAHYDIEPGTNYYGPTSINGLLLGIAKQRDIEGISLWGRVPSYIDEIPNPQVCEAILRVLTRMLDIDIDLSEIETEAHRANKQIDKLVSYLRQHNPDLDRHIGRLERGIITEASREDRQRFFQEIEEFLREQKGHREKDK